MSLPHLIKEGERLGKPWEWMTIDEQLEHINRSKRAWGA